MFSGRKKTRNTFLWGLYIKKIAKKIMNYVFFLWRHGGSVVTMVVSILSHPMTLLIWVMTHLGYTMISMTSHWIPGLVNVNKRLWKDPPWISWENPRTKSSCSSSLFVNVYHWISPRSWPRSQWLGRFSSTRVDASLMDPRPAPHQNAGVVVLVFLERWNSQRLIGYIYIQISTQLFRMFWWIHCWWFLRCFNPHSQHSQHVWKLENYVVGKHWQGFSGSLH